MIQIYNTPKYSINNAYSASFGKKEPVKAPESLPKYSLNDEMDKNTDIRKSVTKEMNHKKKSSDNKKTKNLFLFLALTTLAVLKISKIRK